MWAGFEKAEQMGPPLTTAELAKLYPHLEPWQRSEMERWFRGQNEAQMLGVELPKEPMPWPVIPAKWPS